MARMSRKVSPTDYYHVMMRGINKEKIFKKTGHKQYFTKLLKIIAEEEPIKIVAYCIMNNHVHIAIKSGIDELSQAIKKINIRYAMKFNKDNERIGHVFQDRFKSEIILNDGHLLRVVRYIHDNPVKAKITATAGEYKWSSFNEYANKRYNVLDQEEGKLIYGYFSNKLNLFVKYHREDDYREYLDTAEEIEANRINRANKIIKTFCNNHSITKIEQIHENTRCLEGLVGELLRKSGLSHRRIADLLRINNNIVHKINLEMKTKISK